MKIDRPHWSYSQISQYLRCPLQFYFERVLRLPRPFLPSGLAFGSAIHKALAEYHRHLLQQRELPDRHIEKTFRQMWSDAVVGQPIQFRKGETWSELLDQGVAMLEAYLQEPPPDNIVEVEQTAIVPMITSDGEILEKPLVAIVDLLIREASQLVVTEFKTSSRRYSQLETDMALQASSYSHAVHERTGELPRIRYTILLKTKTPTIQHLDTIRTHADATRLGDIIRMVERAIQANAFYPIESTLNCSTCPFFRPCREWQGLNKGIQPQDRKEVVFC